MVFKDAEEISSIKPPTIMRYSSMGGSSMGGQQTYQAIIEGRVPLFSHSLGCPNLIAVVLLMSPAV
jgi:hypothetical protein